MKIDVLDNGYVELIESWGHGKEGQNIDVNEDGTIINDNEVGIIEAARQSTQGSFRGWETDEKLLKYLYEHNHSTPFEFSGMVIEVQAPIFVFREWHRHRTQSYNEMSARYAPLPNVNYVPTIDRLMVNSDKNKQAGAVNGQELSLAYAYLFQEDVEVVYKKLEDIYQKALNDGIPKELARIILPVGRYSKMRASANLRNWLGFLTLRQDKNAQMEIREYADAVAKIIEAQFPKTYKLYKEGKIK